MVFFVITFCLKFPSFEAVFFYFSFEFLYHHQRNLNDSCLIFCVLFYAINFSCRFNHTKPRVNRDVIYYFVFCIHEFSIKLEKELLNPSSYMSLIIVCSESSVHASMLNKCISSVAGPIAMSCFYGNCILFSHNLVPSYYL